MKKLLKYTIPAILMGLFFSAVVYAIQVTIPSATQVGQVPMGLSNGNYAAGKLIAGTNITITTSTPGQITFSATGSGGSGTISTSTTAQIGKVAIWTGLATLGNGALFDNGTVAGVNATSSTVSFNVQGSGSLNPFNVASSSGTSYVQVGQNGSTTLSSLSVALPVRSTSAGLLFNGAVDLSSTDASGILAAARFPALTGDITTSAGSLATTLKNTGSSGSCTYCSATFDAQGRETAQSSGTTPHTGSGTNGQVAYYTGANTLSSASSLLNNGTVVGVNATSSTVAFNIQGISGSTNTLFNIASSTGTSMMSIDKDGNTIFNRTNSTYSGSQFTINSVAAGGTVFNVDSFGLLTGAAGGYSINSGALKINNSGGTSVITNYNSAANSNLNIYTGFGFSGPTTNQYVELGYSGTASVINDFISNGIGKVTIGTIAPTPGSSTSTTPDLLIEDTNSTSTAPLLAVASSTNTVLFQINANGNVGIGTTTPGQPLVVVGSSTITSLNAANCDVMATVTGGLYCGTNGAGGSGNSAFTIGSGLIYNATSTDLVGIGTITPTTTLFVQGKGGTNPFAIASSTGIQLLTVTQAGNVGIGTTTDAALLAIQVAAGIDPFDIASSTQSVPLFRVDKTGRIFINSNSATTQCNAGGSIYAFCQIDNSTTNNDGFGLFMPNNGGTGRFAVAGQFSGTLCLQGCGTGIVADGNKTTINSNTGIILAVNVGGSENDFARFGQSTSDATGYYNAAFNIGTTTISSGATLFVQGLAGTNNPFNVTSSTGTSLFVVKSTGNIGIGTTNPTSLLTVQGAANTVLFSVATGTPSVFSVNSNGTVSTRGLDLSTPIYTFNQDTSAGLAWGQSGFSGTYVYGPSGTVSLDVAATSIVASHRIVGANGTAALPGFEFANTNNTGMYAPTNNTLGFSSNGVERIRVDSVGRIGIATTTPTFGLVVATTTQLSGLTTSAGLQTAVLCLDANNQVISDSVACLASARRFKTDISPLPVGLAETLQFNPVQFKWTKAFNKGFENDPNKNGVQYSLVADDVQKIDPKMAIVETAGPEKGMVAGLADLNHWVALFVQSFKDMENQITSIMFKQNTDEAKMQKMQTQLDKQQQQINILLQMQAKGQ